MATLDEILDNYSKKPSPEEQDENTAKSFLASFKEKIARNKPLKTGFKKLDAKLDGGLYQGLYVIGSISSLGKTSFCLQIADQLAQQGELVLFVSLEMQKEELIAKLISRITFLTDAKLAKTTRQILNGQSKNYYTKEEKQLIDSSIETFNKYANNIYILEGGRDWSGKEKGDIDEIEAFINKIEETRHKKPVVIIDYLQILAPYDATHQKGQITDKQRIDKNIVELKRLSRDKELIIFCISSFNRENYAEPVSLASFKESGAIEYTSDLLLALQLAGMDYSKSQKGTYESDTERLKRIRELQAKAKESQSVELELKILKNRNGTITKSGELVLSFYKAYNDFEEI